jgi:hypothetical protein
MMWNSRYFFADFAIFSLILQLLFADFAIMFAVSDSVRGFL